MLFGRLDWIKPKDKVMKAIIALTLIAVIGHSLIPTLSRASASADQPSSAKYNDGIQMSLTSTDGDGRNLLLTFQNVSDRDATLNLGIMLANGKLQSPSYVFLKFTDSFGYERLFEFADKRYGAIGGRVDDYVVPLRVGSAYTLKLTLDQFWCSKTNEFEITLMSGENRLTAQFEGHGANYINGDMPGIRLMNFWLGRIESNTLTIKR
jgi:hypothetical protein